VVAADGQPILGAVVTCRQGAGAVTTADDVTLTGLTVASERTTSPGRFVLRDLAPGEHSVTAVHRAHGTRSLNVTVRAGDEAEVTFSLESERQERDTR